MDYREFLERGGEYYLPNLSVDVVIIGYEEGELKCLLLQIGEKWLLPGGYVGRSESVDDAAVRILKERTGLGDPHLKFLSVFGHAERNFHTEWKEFLEKTGQPWREDYWFNTRFVSLAYYSLVKIGELHPVPGAFDQAVAWVPFRELPTMWMDHKAIALQARDHLREDVRHEQISHMLLPSPFTMPELHRLHETILQEKIDRSRFQKKMLASGRYKRLPRLQKDAPGRNPYQYAVLGEQ